MLIVRAWSASLNRELITQCIEEQWDLFVSVLGKQPDFIDGHQHIHQFPFIRDILLQLLKRKIYGLDSKFTTADQSPPYRFKTRMLSALGSNSLAKACQTYHFNQNGQFAGIYDFKLTNYGQLNQYWLCECKRPFTDYVPSSTCTIKGSRSIQHARIQEYQYFSSDQFNLIVNNTVSSSPD